MINLMRKNQKGLMIVITALVIISFCWYWNKADFTAVDSSSVGKAYGRNISRVEFQRHARMLRLGGMLGMSEFLQAMTSGAMDENGAYEQFTWNTLVLRHEADRLGIHPTGEEIANVVRGLRTFSGEKGFDLNKYTEFTKNELAPMGFSEAQIEELAADQLSLARIKRLIGVGVQIPDSENQANLEQAYGKNDVAVIRFRNEDFTKDVQISDDDIAKYFEAHKAQLKSEEKRRVKFVSFALNEEEKKLTGKDRVAPLQKLADRANEFSQAVAQKGSDFDQVAAKFELPVRETAEFTRSAPDPQLPKDPQVTQTAFQLRNDDATSEPVQAGDGFYTLHLLGVSEARALSLEEAKPKIVEALKTERVQQLVATKSAEAAAKIREAIKSGKPTEVAAQEAGMKAEKLPPFTLMQNPLEALKQDPKKEESPELPTVKQAIADLGSGEVSEFVPTENGGLLAILEKREPVDPAGVEQMKMFVSSRYLQNKREVAFFDWLRERRREAGVENPAQS